MNSVLPARVPVASQERNSLRTLRVGMGVKNWWVEDIDVFVISNYDRTLSEASSSMLVNLCESRCNFLVFN